MPASNPMPPVRRSQSGLRADLAAFFIKVSREPAPRRIGSELGVLADLRAQGGYN